MSAGARLRQAVLVAHELDPVAQQLRAELALGDPYRDPGVAVFGLHNAVYALGDAFLEVVAPTQPGTAAGRYLERHGDGGYMVIFQVDDLEAARERAAALGMRTVWQIDLPDISATHLHPQDTRGAIVSIDRPDPPESWRWAGPDWIGKRGTGARGALRGVTIAAPQPAIVCVRWGELLGVPAGGARLELDDGYVAFEEGSVERLAEVEVEVPGAVRRGRDAVEIGGTTFRFG